MITAAVIEREDEHIAQALTERFGGSVRVVRGQGLAQVEPHAPDLIVVSPAMGRELGLSALPEGCRRAVLPLRLPGAGAAVASYGMAAEDTVSLTSNCGEGRMLCVGGMVTLDGSSIERQELRVMPRGMTDDELLAVSAAEMLLGLPPEQL